MEEQAQVGPKCFSIYIHHRHQNGETHQYTVDKAVGETMPGGEVCLRKGDTLLELNGRNLSSLPPEEFFNSLSLHQGSLSLTIAHHHDRDGLQQGAVSDVFKVEDGSGNTCEETTLIVMLQDAKINMLCSDNDDSCTSSIMDTKFTNSLYWECAKIEFIQSAEYLAWTNEGPRLKETGDGMAMLQMRGFNQDKSTQLAALQFSNKLFLKCEGEATDGVILKAEANPTLLGIQTGKSTDIKAVEANKPYLFHAIRKNPDTWHFQSASHSGYYICADGEKIVIARHENDNKYFKIVFNKKCKEMLITHKDTMLHFV
ncbi:uncharacterized protein LOC105893317 [Clupea harengus]|uniref:Uncharacterized protein LOC105893317 n=1 Tax=Clupea harengus TaxID=7950 RepID=A0A6P3VL53_CLUHA|nr:uncharacterized protein LOC105893317 [Clupea harengus]